MLPEFIHVGSPKVASTWLWRVCQEHPGIYVPDVKPTNFFVADYHLGIDWYEETYFGGWSGEPIVGELSNGYMVYEPAIERIARHLPGVKITMLARDPIERSYVHWCHYMKRRHFTPDQFMTMDQMFGRGGFLHFMLWLAPSLYAMQLKRIFRYFPEDQVKVFFYQDLCEDPGGFLASYFAYIGADPSFRPSMLNTLIGFPSPQDPENEELRRGVPPDLRERIKPLIREDVLELQSMAGRDLADWIA